MDFSTIERYKFRESFGYISKTKKIELTNALKEFVHNFENKDKKLFLTFQIVSFNIGIDKDFTLYDGDTLIKLDEISTLRKRLKQSMQNSVPFYLYTNKQDLNTEIKNSLKNIVLNIF